MKFSVWPNAQADPSDVLDTAGWAEDKGWFGFWFADHYMLNSGSAEIRRSPMHECWGMLPAVAAVTSRIRIGALVAPTSVHHPAVLANRAVTIDHISNGRLVLGLGAGWQINEHTAYGIALEPPKQRVDRFDEAIQIVRSLFENEITDFAGSIYTITNAPSDPKPIQSPLPILVGTGSPRMLRITARHADEWNTWGDVTLAGQRREAWRTACESVGRDPSTMHTSVQALMVLDDAATAPDNRTIAGSAAQLVDTIGQYAELGFDEWIIPDFDFGAEPQQRRDMLERIDSEIVAHFR